MSKTQLLSDTENLFIAREKSHNFISEQKWVTWYSNDGTLTLEMETPAFSPCFIFVDSFTINTLQLHKYIKDYLI